MPALPKRKCNYPGCNTLTTTARCGRHEHLNTGTYNDPNRASAQERGYGAAWRKVRAFVLARDLYQCQVAKREGRLEPADEVDHIVSKEVWLQRYGNLDGVDDPGNLQAIGKDRHTEKSQIEAAVGRHGSGQSSYANSYPDWLKPAQCRLVIVFGPPAAGKSTRIEQERKAWHRVIDLDAIISEMSGLPLYQANDHWRDQGVRVRNQRLSALSKAPVTDTAWFATTAAGDRRQWWIDTLRPSEVIDVRTPEPECVARIKSDPRRDRVQAAHIEAVRQWWKLER